MERRLSRPEKVALAAEIVRTHVRTRRVLRREGLVPTLQKLQVVAPSTHDDERTYGEALKLASAVTRVCQRLPIDSRCLMQSLVLTSLLSRRGIGSSLVIGVRSGDEFGAHAWVELDSRPLLPPGTGEYERLVEL
jgi:hypothetical protein